MRIPKDLAIFEPSQDVIIERKGDTLVLRAVERKDGGFGNFIAKVYTVYTMRYC